MKNFLLALCIGLAGLVHAATPQVSSSQSEIECKTAIDRCAPPPKPAPCPPGKHWTLQGSHIAHCVADDPICPPGATVKHDFLGNPSCDIPVVSCNSNQYWDGTTCIMRCPSPMRWDVGTAQCACPQGQYWSDMASTCVNAPVCGTNEVWNPSTNRCDYTGPTCPWGGPQNYPTCACPSNFVWNGGSCIPASCPSGQTWDAGSQACIVVFVPNCPSGTTWNGSVCQPDGQTCPSNQTWNGSSCVSVVPSCPTGTTWDGMSCVANAPVCPSGQIWSGSACVTAGCPASGPQNFPTCACASGTTWNGSTCAVATCPATGPQNYPTCSCPNGTTWDGASCIVPPCPPGKTWNGHSCETNSCNPSTIPSTQACPSPQTGTISLLTTYDCNGTPLSTVQTGSNCQTPQQSRIMWCGATDNLQGRPATVVGAGYMEIADYSKSYEAGFLWRWTPRTMDGDPNTYLFCERPDH